MKKIVIIGAGFSGTLTAIQIARLSKKPLHIVLIEQNASTFGGKAYGTSKQEHLLNVPAGNMSALPCTPGHFLEFCQQYAPDTQSHHFMPRQLYGLYLKQLLTRTAEDHKEQCILRLLPGKAVNLSRHDNGWLIALENGKSLEADHVVLALGNFPPADLAALNKIPTDNSTPRKPTAEQVPTLIIGTGLTAAETALELLACDPRRPVLMLSRRGLLPQSHRTLAPPQALNPITELDSAPNTALGYLRGVRQSTRAYSGDWRDVIAALRPITPKLWQQLPYQERRRFLRHLQTFWDTHRHRIAPSTHEALMSAVNSGRIRVLAGRLINVESHADHLVVELKIKSKKLSNSLKINKVINCTGPDSNILRLDDPLVKQLLKDQLIQPDQSGQGLLVDHDLNVLNSKSESVSGLSYIGPWLKAVLWEATAVPELRQHAQNLARRLIEYLK